jgi:hypothetical protein
MSRISVRALPYLLAGALALAACGGGDSTGPTVTGIGGTWSFAWHDMSATVSGVALSCSVTNVRMTLTQSGESFTGTQTGTATMTCSANGQQELTEPVGGERILDGTVQGAAVSFHLATIPGLHTGTLSGNGMSGDATWTLDLGGGEVVTLTGTWSSTRS